jgi:predicted nucleic acid-binding Zn ribbon protein
LSSKGTRTIGESLTDYFGRHGLVRRISQASIINDWAELVGDQVASVSEPDSVDKAGTLRVRVESAAWLQELQLMSPTIIKGLAFKGRRIKRIHWMLGAVGRQQPHK